MEPRKVLFGDDDQQKKSLYSSYTKIFLNHYVILFLQFLYFHIWDNVGYVFFAIIC